MNEDKIHSLLKEAKIFNLRSSCYDNEYVYAEAYSNCLIVKPLTAEAERDIKFNPYARILSSSKHFYCLYWFPRDIASEENEQVKLKYQSRLDNLFKAKRQGKIELYSRIAVPIKDFVKLKYTEKPYKKRKDYDYKDDMDDTSCKQLAKPPKNFATIEKVSLTYNTFLLLKNAKENKNKALFYYKDVKTFYTDCIINYILMHSQIFSPENFRYPSPITEVRIQAKEFLKFFSTKSNRIKLKEKEGVEIQYSRNAQRLSKNDTVIIKFSMKYLQPYKNIIQRADENIKVPLSFVKIPIFFVLEALSNKNLGVKGFKFLLWFLCLYRISNPYIMHSSKTIMTETGMFLGHGQKQPLKIMQKYFNYLFKVNALKIPQPLKLNKDGINSPPKYNGAFIRIQKPKKTKEKN